jgi:hypothetical protein
MANATKTPALNAQQIQNRQDFKEAYYGITDKRQALSELFRNLENREAAGELDVLIMNLQNLTDKLAAFADKNLTNWD